MRMNSGIILQGQQPDIVGSAARGFEAGRKNRLAGIYDQYGAGIASGDKNALAALAQFDPTAAMQAQRGLQVMQHADAQEGRLNRQEQRMIEAEAANLSAQERAAQLAQIEQGVAMGMATQTPQEWDALMSQYAPDLVGQFDNRQMHANRFLSVAEVLKGMEAPGAQSPAGKLADDLRNGLITQEQYDTATTKTPLVSNVIGGGDQKLPEPPSGFTYAQNKNGGVMMEDFDLGGGRTAQRPMLVPLAGTKQAADAADIEKGEIAAIDGAQRMLETIDSVMNDPALDWATGVTSPTQNLPGTGAYRAGTKINQLQGQVFLDAYERLKGGGVITEIEGKKAEQALARLDSGLSHEDFTEALGELKEVVETGLARAKLRASQRSIDLSDDELLKMYGD